MTLAERLLAKVEPCLIVGCWLWTDAPDEDGYGRLWVDGQTLKAHRVSWEVHFGPIPAGAQVLHRCDTPPCINPQHLFLGSHAENMADREAKGRGRVPVPPRLRGDDHPHAILTEQTIAVLRACEARGEAINRTHTAAALGVSVSTLSRAMTGKTWGPIAPPA
jgi:hypothetical protein